MFENCVAIIVELMLQLIDTDKIFFHANFFQNFFAQFYFQNFGSMIVQSSQNIFFAKTFFMFIINYRCTTICLMPMILFLPVNIFSKKIPADKSF